MEVEFAGKIICKLLENKDLTIKYGEQLKLLFMFFYFMGMVLHGKSGMSKIWMQWEVCDGTR